MESNFAKFSRTTSTHFRTEKSFIVPRKCFTECNTITDNNTTALYE
uniref:Uncharacterized protein n=1 Tax=Anguilla anguilla TaxID=7936 RepID=A0A0E9QFJ9_ANGAN